eukprot:gene3481-3944_t
MQIPPRAPVPLITPIGPVAAPQVMGPPLKHLTYTPMHLAIAMKYQYQYIIAIGTKVLKKLDPSTKYTAYSLMRLYMEERFEKAMQKSPPPGDFEGSMQALWAMLASVAVDIHFYNSPVNMADLGGVTGWEGLAEERVSPLRVLELQDGSPVVDFQHRMFMTFFLASSVAADWH